MKIAVASEGLDVSQHFGHCSNYNYFTVANGAVVDCQNMPSPGHLCDSMAPLMKELDVGALITGGIGAGAKSAFDAHNIPVVTGASGNARQAVEDYLSGQLTSSSRFCAGHGEPCANN
ncbi:MAG: NifB/NifX family molybdenum-iron cluster-binding protein [Raoultibacter sp.]